MSEQDEQVGTTPEEPQEDSVSSGQSDAEDEGGSPANEGKQSEARAQERTPVNLHDIPQFRELQSQYDRRISQLERQLTQERERQRRAEYEQLPEDERTQRELFDTKRELAQMRFEMQKRTDLERLSRLSGAPVEELLKAERYDDAVEMALGWKDKQRIAEERDRKKKREERDRKLADNSTHVGTPSPPPTPANEHERKKKELLESGNAHDYYKMILEE